MLSPGEAAALLTGDVQVEEKVDGANIGISVDEDGHLRVQNRGSYLEPEHTQPQFRPIWSWLYPREPSMVDALSSGLVLFGEWCYAVHSVPYNRLPDWFLGFDVYDLREAAFWDCARRNELLQDLALCPVPALARGRFSIAQLRDLTTGDSELGDGPMEGLVIRREGGGRTLDRAKLVRAEFAQAIDEHWSRRPLRRNALEPEAQSVG